MGQVGKGIAVCVGVAMLAAAQAPVREVAITFDDLPVAGVLRRDVTAGRALTSKLLSAIAAHGYRVAPVTVDNDDYIFAEAYDRASARGKKEVMRRVAAAYVPYMEAKFAFFERNSMELFGREMRQVLLVHANGLNADEFDRLAGMMERRGYRFITLERALEDPAFQSPDRYVGSGGITWLHRWALARAMPKAFFKDEPDVPAFVADAAKMGR